MWKTPGWPGLVGFPWLVRSCHPTPPQPHTVLAPSRFLQELKGPEKGHTGSWTLSPMEVLQSKNNAPPNTMCEQGQWKPGKLVASLLHNILQHPYVCICAYTMSVPPAHTTIDRARPYTYHCIPMHGHKEAGAHGFVPKHLCQQTHSHTWGVLPSPALR